MTKRRNDKIYEIWDKVCDISIDIEHRLKELQEYIIEMMWEEIE